MAKAGSCTLEVEGRRPCLAWVALPSCWSPNGTPPTRASATGVVSVAQGPPSSARCARHGRAEAWPSS
eukprot:601199-Pyramimonas_sp.AAC.1